MKNVVQFKCLLPTAGDITNLCWIYIYIIQVPIIIISLYQLCRVSFNSLKAHKSMDSNFIQKAMDDPLSYSALWTEKRYKQYMTRATIPEAGIPIVSEIPKVEKEN